jgi:hypothetical protein
MSLSHGVVRSQLSVKSVAIGACSTSLIVVICIMLSFVVGGTYQDLVGRFYWLLPFAITAMIALIWTSVNWNTIQPSTRAALVVFVLLPISVVGITTPVSDCFELTALRVTFLVVVCFLPATMWYLFLLTRKASLFNEFLSNLSRLGLLVPTADENVACTQRRVKSYIQRFEARYGGLNATHKRMFKTFFGRCSKAEAEACTPMTICTGLVPVVLATILIAIGWITALPPWKFLSEIPAHSPHILEALKPNSNPTTLAFLGSYFFCLQMLFRRYVLKDLGGAAYFAISIRIVVAVIGIWTVEAVVGQDDQFLLQLLGFVFGMFPRIVWQFVATLFKRLAGVIMPSLISQLPLSDLDGLTVWHETRLEEKDVENIPNMATADLVDLLLDTRLTPERLIDWTDQAILYTYLGPQEKGKQNVRQALRALGIRTATSFLQASKVEHREGKELLNGIILAGSKNGAVDALEAALATNPNLELIRRWHGLSDASSRRVGPSAGLRVA